MKIYLLLGGVIGVVTSVLFILKKKKLFFSAFATVALGAAVVLSNSANSVTYEGAKKPDYIQSPKDFIVVADTATTTKSIPARFTHTLDPKLTGQGVCIRIEDIDGQGVTYLSTLKGVPTFSTISCE